MRGKQIIYGFLVVVVLLIIYLLFWPVPIYPVAWTPPEAPVLSGVYEVNRELATVQRLGAGAGIGPEDVAVDMQDRLYGGMEDGRIMRFQPDGSRPEIFADTGGRPLGMDFDAAGNLVVADAYRGLLSVAPDGSVTVLSREAAGVTFGLTDDVDVANNGTIYFSDASFKFPLTEVILDFLEHRPHGRLLAYDSNSKRTRVILDGLYFANGVAVSPNDLFVLVVESGKYRVKRVWIAGPREGESDIFIDNLPGMPDSISCNGKDTFWLALFALRDPKVDGILSSHPFLRKIIMRLPGAMSQAPKRYSFVLGLDVSGQVTCNLQDPSGWYAPITSVEQHKDTLFLGSVSEDAIGCLPVP